MRSFLFRAVNITAVGNNENHKTGLVIQTGLIKLADYFRCRSVPIEITMLPCYLRYSVMLMNKTSAKCESDSRTEDSVGYTISVNRVLIMSRIESK